MKKIEKKSKNTEKILLKSHAVEIPIFTGEQQVHVTADIAYGVWNYWYCTGDVDFMKNCGVEILFETARFWSSRCTKESGRYHIDHVVGPDEYHHGVRDNAYTNWMARFNLKKAIWARDWLAECDPLRLAEVCLRLGFKQEDFREWSEVASRIYLPQPGADGVIEQFDGFFNLNAVTLDKSDRLKSPLKRLLDWKQVNSSKICKQADVLMLPFLFPDHFSDEVVRANYHYYEPITDHGSSLSPPVHALIAARIGAIEDAAAYYEQSVELDLFNLMQNTSLGVHAACMGGSWQALVFGLMGVRLGDSGPRLDSHGARSIPKKWGALRCRILFRGKEHELEVSAA
ncbi:glycoside hydrolase family 65 protein [bacterium]|nr:glycoside hydrolase family 65 protein [bacterium]